MELTLRASGVNRWLASPAVLVAIETAERPGTIADRAILGFGG